MNIKKYIAFLKVVEHGTVTKAAEELGNTQSGVTQLLHALESDLGFCLMTRSRSGIQLTAEGQRLYPLIMDVVNTDRKLQDEVLTIKNEDGKTIRIGTFKSVAVNWLPNMIQEYQQYDHDIHFELVDGGYNNIEQELAKQDLDFAFAPLPLKLNCKCIPLCEDRLLAVLPTNHPAVREKACPIHLFETEPVISLIDTIDRDARTVYTSAGIRPNIKYTMEDDYAMLAMVEKNLGICIVPELILQGNKKKVKVMELDPPAIRTIGIVFPSYENAKPSSKKFAEFASEWVKKKKQ